MRVSNFDFDHDSCREKQLMNVLCSGFDEQKDTDIQRVDFGFDTERTGPVDDCEGFDNLMLLNT